MTKNIILYFYLCEFNITSKPILPYSNKNQDMKKRILLLILPLLAGGGRAVGADAENYQGVPVTLNLSTPGTLRQSLYAMDVEDISVLTISGSLDASDLKYIAEGSGAIPTAEYIDVSGVTLVPGGEAYVRRQLTAWNSTRIYVDFYISDECKIEVNSRSDWLGSPITYYDYQGNNFAGVFAKLENLQKVRLPGNITEIGPATFRDCTALKDLLIPGGVRTIHQDAFAYSGVESLTVPSGLSMIDRWAFYRSSIKEIAGSAGVDSIGYQAFCGSKIETMDLTGLSKLGEAAFKSRYLKGVLRLQNLAVVPEEAFSGSDITSLVLGPKTEKLGDYAFQNCKSLASVEMSETLTDIGSSVFDGTPWYKNLPPVDGVKYVNTVACELDADAPSTVTIREGTLRIAPKFASNYRESAVKKVIFPESLKVIGEAAFSGMESLTSVVFGDNVESIGSDAFYNCTNLGFSSLPANLRTIGGGTFQRCLNIFEVSLGTKLETIGKWAFGDCSSISKIELHSTRAVGSEVFSNLNQHKIVIGKDVELISSRFFYNSKWLTDIEFEDRPDSKPLRIEDESFGLYTNNYAVDVHNVPSGISYIGRHAFYNAHFEGEFDFSRTDTIESYAFWNASGLPSRLVIPVNMKKMAHSAFLGVSDIKEVELHAAKLECGNYTPFAEMYEYIKEENTTLKRAIIGKEVEETPYGFLYGCTALESLEFEERPADGSLPLVINGDLYGCQKGLASIPRVEFPDGLVSLAVSSLDKNIEEFSIPASFKTFSGSRPWDYSPNEAIFPRLRVMTCYASVPPEKFSTLRYYTLKDIQAYYSEYYPLDVYVPYGSKEAYLEDKDFATCNIIEMQTSGVKAPGVGGNAGDDQVDGIYTLSGQKVRDMLSGGVYIVRYRSGRVEKVVAPGR